MRKCTLCSEVKPDSAFYINKRRGEFSKRCKECVGKLSREWQAKNPERARQSAKDWRDRNRRKHQGYSLMKSYGLTVEEYDELLRKHEGRCAICHKAPNGKRLGVDHDHATGRIRGLLCHSCNIHLGLFEMFPEFEQRAREYLGRFL